MARLPPFTLDTWVREFKAKSQTSLHDTCVMPLSLQKLATLADDDVSNHDAAALVDYTAPISYGPTLGKPQLEEKILELYRDSTEQNTMPTLHATVTSGCVSANYLVLSTLLGPGDHMIVQYPCYQQFFEVPRHMGADVSLWKSRPENRWQPNISELQHLVKPNTKLLMINTPNNPTGVMLSRSEMEKIVDFVKRHGIILLCDEIFRGLYHPSFSAAKTSWSFGTSDPDVDFPTSLSFATNYKKIVATCSLSKTYRMPGIRVGWVASPDKALIDMINMTRDYTTIAVSQIDQDIATFALTRQTRLRIVESSLAICKTNLQMLEAFVDEHPDQLEWVRPLYLGGSCTFIKIRNSRLTDKEYCEDMIAKTGLLVVPGGYTFGNGLSSTGSSNELDHVGYLRVGFVNSPEQFRRCLELWDAYLRSAQG